MTLTRPMPEEAMLGCCSCGQPFLLSKGGYKNGDLQLCDACYTKDTIQGAFNELGRALDELKAAILEAIASAFKGKP